MKSNTRKLTALILALVIAFSAFSMTALAADESSSEQATSTESEESITVLGGPAPGIASPPYNQYNGYWRVSYNFYMAGYITLLVNNSYPVEYQITVLGESFFDYQCSSLAVVSCHV
jgi:hypothetical protein